MEFGVLGPLLARDTTGPVVLASAKQRALLAVLLLEARHEVVLAERLIHELWGDDPPATATKSLQVHVSQLRRALGPRQPIVTRPTGYAVQITDEALDLHRFEHLLAQARRLRAAGDHAGALRALTEALALWRGPALADVTLLGAGAAEADRLESLRALAHEDRIELALEREDGAALVPELEALISAHPYRERLYGLLMLALYRDGRQADALAVFRRARTLLVEDLGIEPGAELDRLEAAILAQDPALDRAARAAAVPAPAQAQAGGGIPRVTTSIFGRAAELSAAIELIERPDVRLLTLTGVGGIGKTRVALELATLLAERSRFAELAAITDPSRVMAAISAAVGAEDPTHDAAVAALRSAAVVLFLDNFEQVLAAAPSVAAILSDVASLTVVVTSRAPLRIAGEHELPLPPLARDPAVELFVERARAQNPRFSPGPEALGYVEEICARIDGIPLAIELAAARTRVLEPRDMLDRLGSRLDLLTAGRRDAPERHRTLRATIAWSHDLLEPPEQRLFEHLAVCQSSWSLDAAEAIADSPVLDALSALVDQGLVIREGSRFRMLETVREYAAERLAASSAAMTAGRRHAHWCLRLAEAAEPELEGAQQATWFARLDAEHENLRAASGWGVANGEPEITLGIDGALWRFWLARGAAAEVRSGLTTALASGGGGPALRATALNAAGVLAGETSDFPAAQAAFEASLELATQLGDRRQMARALANLGVIAVFTEDYDRALRRYGEAADIWHELGDIRGRSIMCQNLAIVHELRRDYALALPLLEESVELARAAGDRMNLATTLITLARLLVYTRPDDRRCPALLREGLELSGALGDRLQVIACLEVAAQIAASGGEPVTATELVGAAGAERERAGAKRKPDESPFLEQTEQELEQSLDHEAYQRALERGHNMSLEAATAIALTFTGSAPEAA